MSKLKLSTIVTGLVVVCVAAWGCSDSKPTDPGGGGGGGGGGGTGTLSQALDTASAQFFEQNGGTFQSLAYFGPLIEAVAGPVRAVDPYDADAASASCMDPALLGKVFDFDGSTYVATALPGAPADGARFLLYEVDGTGAVNLANQIGHFDVTCTGTTPSISMTLGVVVGGLTRLSATFNGTYPSAAYNLNYTGTVYDANAASLPINGLLWGAYDGTVVTNGAYSTLGTELGTLTFGYGILVGSDSGDAEGFMTAVNIPSSIDWTVYSEFFAHSDGSIYDGYVTYDNGFSYLTVACLGGTLSAPLIIDPAVGDCTREGSTNGSYPLGDAADATAAYLALQSMHDQLHSILQVSLATVAP